MSPRVLVVVDEPEIAELVRPALESDGYEVLEAADGVAGLELMTRLRPAAVVVDLQLPRLHGLGVLAAARSNPMTDRIPIVLLGTRARVDDEETAMALGADGFVAEPFGGVAVIELVRRLHSLPTDELLARRLARRLALPQVTRAA